MPSVSAFQHPVSQFVPGSFGYWTGSPYSGTRLVRHRNFCSFWYRTDWMLDTVDSLSFRQWKKLLVVVAIGIPSACLLFKLQVVESKTLCTSIDSCWWCYSCYMILKNHINMLECWTFRRKVCPALAFLLVVSCLRPASAFKHQGSVWYRWSQISLALPS